MYFLWNVNTILQWLRTMKVANIRTIYMIARNKLTVQRSNNNGYIIYSSLVKNVPY